MGYLGVEVKALPALRQALLLGEDAQRTHNLQTVGQLHEDDTWVLGVGDNHISKIRSLLLRPLEFDIRNLAQRQCDAQRLLAILVANV